MSDAYQQYENQKELARLQRRMHGADTTLDEAEVRHDAIWGRVWAMRSGMPFMLGIGLGWLGPEPSVSATLAFAALWIDFVVGHFFGGVNDLISGKFKRTSRRDAENAWSLFVGLVAFGTGMSLHLTGFILTGAAIFLKPIIWPIWARRVMAKTDYARLRSQPPAAPALGIME